MFGLQILDLVIGLIFIYFILSLVCSIVQEIFANLLNLRYKNLQKWIENTFSLNGLGKAIVHHKIIESLTRSCKPSYIPADKFVHALLDKVNAEIHGEKPFDINSLREAVDKTTLLPAEMKRFLLQSIHDASGDLSRVREDMEQWFNDAMDRISGAYKKKVQLWILLISFFVVTTFNADSIRLTKYLYDHPAVAKSLADQAAQAVNDPTFKKRIEEIKENDTVPGVGSHEIEEIVSAIEADISRIDSLSQKLSSAQLPLGWAGESSPADCWEWVQKIIGIIVSILAVSLGAPFWFETLNKLVNLRNAGKKPQ